MHPKLKESFNFEMNKAIQFYNKEDLEQSFVHLERAHILGQTFVIPHTKTHLWMMKIGWKKHDYREVFGQITRMIASILFSRVWVPVGNTGGANVNPLKPMPIPKDLQKIIDDK